MYVFICIRIYTYLYVCSIYIYVSRYTGLIQGVAHALAR